MKKLFVIFLLFTSLVSCTRIDFGLKFFSFYVKSEVDDMFDLSAPQKDLLDKHFSAELEKAKHEQFPLYADFLDKIVEAAESPSVTGEKVSQLFDEGAELFLQAPPKWRASAQEFIESLKPEQFSSFEDYFNKKIKKQKNRNETLQDREKHQLKEMEKWINESIEDLTRGQEDRLKQYIKANPKPYILGTKSQEYVFIQFKEAFPDPEKRKLFVQKVLTNWHDVQLPEYLKARALYQAKLKDFIMDLSLNLNGKQKKNLIQNLKSRAAELRKIAHKTAT